MRLAGHEPLGVEDRRSEVELHVGRVEVVARPREPAGLGDVRGEGALTLGLEACEVLVVQRAEEAHLAVGQVDRPCVRVVVEVQAHARGVGHDRDLQQLELLRAAQTGQHQELRRVVRAAGDDDLALGPELEWLAEADALDAHRALTLEEELQHLDVCLDREVRAVHRGVQVRHGGAGPGAPPVGDLVPADAVLLGSVEVVVRLQPAGLGGIDERPRERVHRAAVRDGKRPAGAVPVVGAAFVVLGALEVGQHLVVAPPGPDQVAPLVVVRAIAADVDHGVDRGAAAKDLAARQVDPPVAAVRLVPGRVIPVLRAAVERRERRRDVHEVVRVRAARLDQEDADVRVLSKAVREHAARRPRTDDHVVVHAVSPRLALRAP